MMIKRDSDIAPIPAEAIGISGADRLSVRPLVTQADGIPTFSVSLLELDVGGSTPDHSHEREEVIYAKSGTGILACPNERIDVGPGNVVYFSANEPHRFINTGEEPLILICVTEIT